ncbi:UPF0187 protein At2g45870, chloroplastic [Hondaea fermentalgiana]|uniref:UPF0187 protein At2g45870, chloroplastic n=1 Tax=Hondaea fermentalgiana TaxID=2315210 RepID=A0A2R5GA60_9STRA|nr:UPF0187 protein At2g45870, chloroplastic [Hondaea fermentalgiana]|eukprot:GBG27906.1 UPF0187 protein At2g45870, chloroplastic [Hondaea fermentalgiana]
MATRTSAKRYRTASSAVSPMGQVILTRANTTKITREINEAKHTIAHVDRKLLKARDQKPSTMLSLKGVWDLFAQLRVLTFALYHCGIASYAQFTLMGSENLAESMGYVDILGWVVGLMVAFRQREGMLRWWEGRSAWGRLTTVSRDLVRSVLAYNHSKPTSMSFAMYSIAFPIAMKNCLRGEYEFDRKELKLILSELDLEYVLQHSAQDRALAILDLMSGTVVMMMNEGTISASTVNLVLEPKIQALNECFGSCLRIKDTPIPDMYRVFLDLVIFLFLGSLPFSLLSDKWNPISVAVICTVCSCVLNGLAKLAGQMENPFDDDPNDLPLGAYTAAIMDQIMHISDRWFKPNSILYASKMAQKKRHALDEKIKRAQVKAMVIASFSHKRRTTTSPGATPSPAISMPLQSSQTDLLGHNSGALDAVDPMLKEYIVGSVDEDDSNLMNDDLASADSKDGKSEEANTESDSNSQPVLDLVNGPDSAAQQNNAHTDVSDAGRKNDEEDEGVAKKHKKHKKHKKKDKRHRAHADDHIKSEATDSPDQAEETDLESTIEIKSE